MRQLGLVAALVPVLAWAQTQPMPIGPGVGPGMGPGAITSTPLMPPTVQYPTQPFGGGQPPMQPAPGQPGPMQPRPVQPGPMPPAPMQPAPMQPAPTQPGPAQPGLVPPAPVQPGTIQPGPTPRGPTQPDPNQPTAPQPAPPGQAAPVPGQPAEPPVAPEQPPLPPNPWLPQGGAVLQLLDKVNAQSATMTVKVGQSGTFGSLKITVQACVVRPPDMPQDAAASLVITDTHADQPGFTGWIMKSAPSVSMLQHPIYDVRVAGCTP